LDGVVAIVAVVSRLLTKVWLSSRERSFRGVVELSGLDLCQYSAGIMCAGCFLVLGRLRFIGCFLSSCDREGCFFCCCPVVRKVLGFDDICDSKEI